MSAMGTARFEIRNMITPLDVMQEFGKWASEILRDNHPSLRERRTRTDANCIERAAGLFMEIAGTVPKRR
jgi:hypothetical protein